jgi:hypothetical protein
MMESRCSWRPQIPVDLIVCSSTPLWHAAVRNALLEVARRTPQLAVRLLEVEEFADLLLKLELAPNAVIGLEIGNENLRGCLRWLATARASNAPVVGLLSLPPCPTDIHRAAQHRHDSETIETVVREAGAVWTLRSPLEATQIVEIAVRRTFSCAPKRPSNRALSDEIWRSLPWHSPRPPLRLTAAP